MLPKDGLHLTLPWPHRNLSPNARVHWGVRHRHAHTARTAGFYIAKECGVELDPKLTYQVRLFFHPPAHRTYDLDNLLASMKSTLDGVCLGLGIDDSSIKPVPDWGEKVTHGKVEMVITEIRT